MSVNQIVRHAEVTEEHTGRIAAIVGTSAYVVWLTGPAAGVHEMVALSTLR